MISFSLGIGKQNYCMQKSFLSTKESGVITLLSYISIFSPVLSNIAVLDSLSSSNHRALYKPRKGKEESLQVAKLRHKESKWLAWGGTLEENYDLSSSDCSLSKNAEGFCVAISVVHLLLASLLYLAVDMKYVLPCGAVPHWGCQPKAEELLCFSSHSFYSIYPASLISLQLWSSLV